MKEKLRELYQNGQAGITPCISANGLLKAVANGWITLDDAVEIIGSEDTLPIVRAAKLKEISIACNETIVNGVDLTFDGETVHFNLSTEDQANIANLFRVVELGGTEFPYQADGGVCRIYTASEIATIYIAAQTLITTQTTYHNELKAYADIYGLDGFDFDDEYSNYSENPSPGFEERSSANYCRLIYECRKIMPIRKKYCVG